MKPIRHCLNHLALAAALGASFQTGAAQAALTWNLGGDGNWDTTTANWTGSATVFVSNGSQNVIFNNSAGGTISIASGMQPLTTTVSATSGIYTFSGGPLAGAGSLTKSGNGALTITDLIQHNTYTGGTNINGGSLYIYDTQDFNPLGTGPVTLNSGTLWLDRATVTSNVTVNGGSLIMDNGFGSAITGAITSNVQLDITAYYVSHQFSGGISGSGGITLGGYYGGGVNLSGMNTYAGPTVVNDGNLQVSSLYGNNQAQWTPANITVASGGALIVNVGGAGEFTAAQAGTLFTNLSTVNNNGLKAGSSIGFATGNSNTVQTVSAILRDSTGPGGGVVGLQQKGTGTLQLTGANTYSGQTSMGGGGTLQVSSFNSVVTNVGLGTVHSASSSLGAPTTVVNGTILIGTGYTDGTLVYTGAGETTDRVIHFANGWYGSLTLDQSGTGLLKFNNPLEIDDGGEKTLYLTGSTVGRGEIVGAIPNSSSLSLDKSGTGTWTLAGANNYTGTTTVNAGTLSITSAGALGATAGGTTVASGAALALSGGIAVGAEAVSITGTGVGGNGALKSTAGTNSLAGAITLDGNSSIQVDLGSLTLSGPISGAGQTLTKTGAGTLNLDNAAQSYDGLTANAGITNVNGSLGTAPGLAVVTVTGAGTALKFGSVSQTLSSLSIGAGATVTFTSGIASFSGGGNASGFLPGAALVPEPGSLGLLLTGALGLLARRRRA